MSSPLQEEKNSESVRKFNPLRILKMLQLLLRLQRVQVQTTRSLHQKRRKVERKTLHLQTKSESVLNRRLNHFLESVKINLTEKSNQRFRAKFTRPRKIK